MLNKVCKQSAGILLYKLAGNALEIFLVHPGGPFWKNKDLGAWTIPKGEFTKEENAFEAAIREFKEETGTLISGNFIELKAIKQKSGKIVYAWAVEGDIVASKILCETFIKIEWPPKSGNLQNIPEVDKGEWFSPEVGKLKINPSQATFIDELISKLNKPYAG